MYAALRYARILTEHGVTDLAGVADIIVDPKRWAGTNRPWPPFSAKEPTAYGGGYLWMLCGSNDVSKLDRMIPRWLTRHGHHRGFDLVARVPDGSAEPKSRTEPRYDCQRQVSRWFGQAATS
jgi:hypothetical protein